MHYRRIGASLWVIGAVLAVAIPAAVADPYSPTTVILQTAPTAPKNPNETTTAAKTNYEKREICRPQQVTGTRIAQMVCMTESQMDARRKGSQAWKSELDLQRDRGPPPGGGVTGG
jgi:hypothetical protein